MIISRHQVASVLRAYGLAQTEFHEAAGASGKARQTPGRDRLELSEEAAAVRRFVAMARDLPEVRAERVAELRERIARGDYRVDPEAVAERLLYRLLADRAQEGR